MSGGKFIGDANETREFKLSVIAGVTNPTHSYVYVITQEFVKIYLTGTLSGTYDFTSGSVSFGSATVTKNQSKTGFYFNDGYSSQRGWNSTVFY